MNQAKFEQLSKAYLEGLEKAVIDNPDDYGGRHIGTTPSEYAAMVGARMLGNIASGNFFRNSYDSQGWRNARKSLGIKNTQKAIYEFLEIVK